MSGYSRPGQEQHFQVLSVECKPSFYSLWPELVIGWSLGELPLPRIPYLVRLPVLQPVSGWFSYPFCSVYNLLSGLWSLLGCLFRESWDISSGYWPVGSINPRDSLLVVEMLFPPIFSCGPCTMRNNCTHRYTVRGDSSHDVSGEFSFDCWSRNKTKEGAQLQIGVRGPPPFLFEH